MTTFQSRSDYEAWKARKETPPATTEPRTSLAIGNAEVEASISPVDALRDDETFRALMILCPIFGAAGGIAVAGTAGAGFAVGCFLVLAGIFIGFCAAGWLFNLFRMFMFDKPTRRALEAKSNRAAEAASESRNALKHARKERERQRQELIESGIVLEDHDREQRIRFDEQASRLYFLKENKSYAPEDFVGAEIIDDQETIASVDRAGQIAGALVGGALAGGDGAVIGGLSSSRRIKTKCERLALKIVVCDPTNPVHTIDILRKPLLKKTGWLRNGYAYKTALQKAQFWQGRILALMKQAADSKATQDSAAAPRLPIDTLSAELGRLQSLHAQGALSDDEYTAAKARVLAIA